jgi:predicted dehydrogenase
VAICDVRAELARDFAQQFGIRASTGDWQTLVGRPDIDVIDVVTPSATHFELSMAALESGKHVLCEKPVAYDFRRTLQAAARARQKRLNIDDGDIFIGEYANGAIGSIQTSFVTIGNYPGIEARIYGEQGAIICRLVEEFGVAETVKLATPGGVEFKQVEVPQQFYPTGGHPRESWRSLFYANLIKDFIDEILAGGEHNQGNFADGAWVQETINAVERSFHQRRWVDLPLER